MATISKYERNGSLYGWCAKESAGKAVGSGEIAKNEWSWVGSSRYEGNKEVDVEVIEVVEEQVSRESDSLSAEETFENKTDSVSVDDCGGEEKEAGKGVAQSNDNLVVGGESNVPHGNDSNSVDDLALGGGEDNLAIAAESGGNDQSESDLMAGKSEGGLVVGESQVIGGSDGDTVMAREGSSKDSMSDEGMCY